MDSVTKGAEIKEREHRRVPNPEPVDPSAQRLAAIVESSDDAIISKDLRGIITSWNKAAEQILGYTEQEVIGRSIALIIPPEMMEEESGLLKQIHAGEQIKRFHTVRVRKNGERILVSLSISPVRDECGRIVGAAKILRELGKPELAEEAALRLAAIVESSEDAIISKDLNGKITSWNKAAERILGYKADEVVGRPITIIIPTELRDEESRILAKLVSGQRIEHFETVRLTKQGERIDVSLTISPVRNAHGMIIGAAKILRDITQQRKLEAALHTSEKLASVGRLAATIAHEINNPLESVTNFVYLAKHYPGLPDEVKRYLNCADQELGRVAHIAQQTLGFYRDSSRPVLLVVPEIVDDLLSIYDRKFRYKELKIERQVEPGLTVCALEGELKQVLSNLLMNAIQASPDGGKIVVRARSCRDVKTGRLGARISIADNGPGIPETHRKMIFAPFFTTKNEVGTGLGLWISRELLEKKGGRIHFRSRNSQPSGTVMTVYIPAGPVQAAHEMIA